MGSRSAIERCVGDPARFAREVWTQRPRLYPRIDPDAFVDVLSLDAVDRLIGTGGLRHPALRVVRDGTALPRASYCAARNTAATRVTDAIDPEAVLAAFDDGATVVLQGLHRFVHEVQRFCRELEGFFGHPLQANAYLTPPRARGLGTHHDTHDVLVLQLFGTKRWSTYAPEVPDPVEGFPQAKRHPRPNGAPEVRTLSAGDCLYLPRGVPHHAEGLDSASLHLTLGVRSPTWMDVLARVMEHAKERPSLRAALPIGYASHPGAFEAALTDVLGQTADWLRELDPAAIAAAEAERFHRSQRPVQVGRLRTLAEGGDVDDDTELARVGEVAWRLEVDEARATLRAGGVTLRFPRRVEPALRRLLALDVVEVAAFAEHLDAKGARVLLRRLHREGLLRRCDER